MLFVYLGLRVEEVQAALAQRKSQIETHGPSPFKRQSLRQKGPTELEEGMPEATRPLYKMLNEVCVLEYLHWGNYWSATRKTLQTHT